MVMDAGSCMKDKHINQIFLHPLQKINGGFNGPAAMTECK
jgi:hypothetical protein